MKHRLPASLLTVARRLDVRLTRQLAECARLLDLRVHDHLVIGRGRFVSLAEQGII